MENIKINIDPDGLKAKITITARNDTFPAKEKILRALSRAGVKYGIDQTKLEEIVRNKEPVYDSVIAKGRLPVKGKPASLKWNIPLTPQAELQNGTSENKRIDFKQSLLFYTVKANQVIVTKIPAQKGQDGVKVTGEVISSLGDDITLPAGKNTKVSEDGLSLISAIDGSAYYRNRQVNVDKILHIKGDVNYGTGNIKFAGPVVIEGDVRSGFRVEAKDSIMIGGNVEAAHIYSQQGDITIKYGVVGKKRAKILAGSNLYCGYIQDATVGVRGDIRVYHYIINCSVSAGGRIIVKGEEGQIRGGTLTSEKGIEAASVGSNRNIYTELKILNHGQNSSQKKLWELSRLRADLTLRHSTLEKRFKFLELLQKEVSDLSDEKLAEIEFLNKELKRLKNRLMQLDDEEILLQKETARERMLKEIVIEENLYPNVHIEINGLGFHADELLSGVKIFRFKDEIIIESLKEISDREYDVFVPDR